MFVLVANCVRILFAAYPRKGQEKEPPGSELNERVLSVASSPETS